MGLPCQVNAMLRTASKIKLSSPSFRCDVFGSTWDAFVEEWTPQIYGFILNALGPYGREPLKDILPLTDGMHAAGATASFMPTTGQVRVHASVEGDPGKTLEKLTHEFIHASLAQFPEGDTFYEEGFVDYSTWVLAHAPIWGSLGQAMLDSAQKNIDMRRERALKSLSDWDIKRWAGGHYAATAKGPHIIAGLRMKKIEGNFTWY